VKRLLGDFLEEWVVSIAELAVVVMVLAVGGTL